MRQDGKLVELLWHRLNRRSTLLFGFSLIAAIALIDSQVAHNVSLGALYIIPLILMASALRWWHLLILGLLCSLLREAFSPFAFQNDYAGRIAMVWVAFSAASLLTSQLALNRRLLARQVELERENLDTQRAAAEQLSVLVDTSPLAILITDAEGRLLVANGSARKTFGFTADYGSENVGAYIPALSPKATAPYLASGLQTEIECRARRKDGGSFLARVWFSSWGNGPHARLQAVVWDASEEFADLQVDAAKALMTSSKILVTALAHEVRNLAAAARNVFEMIRPKVSGPEADLEPLGEILKVIESLGTRRLVDDAGRIPSSVDLGHVLDEAHIMIEHTLGDSGVALEWDVPERLPRVFADSATLMQVLLNLTNNSREAVGETGDGRIRVEARIERGKALVLFLDNGPGVAEPQTLFRPFLSSSSGTGLGLYISRALVRSFGGDLCYRPTEGGACFSIELQVEASAQILCMAKSASSS